jgi:hypothetical protein
MSSCCRHFALTVPSAYVLFLKPASQMAFPSNLCSNITFSMIVLTLYLKLHPYYDWWLDSPSVTYFFHVEYDVLISYIAHLMGFL